MWHHDIRKLVNPTIPQQPLSFSTGFVLFKESIKDGRKNLAKSAKTVTVVAVVLVVAIAVGLLAANPFAPQQVSESVSETVTESPGQSVSSTREVAVIETEFGNIVIEFFPDKAPKHVENFKKLASEGFYDGTTFHRVIPGFMIQGGDPNSKDNDKSNDGFGGPGYSLPQELNDLSHVRGILSMARSQADSGSQFFIMVGDAPNLDGDFSPFGRVIEGMDVVDQIVNVDRDERDNPITRVEVKITMKQG